MLLGREPRRFGGINTRAMNRRARATLERLGLDIDPGSLLGDHPIAIQQLVAIARAVDVDARVADPRRAHLQPRRRRGREAVRR